MNVNNVSNNEERCQTVRRVHSNLPKEEKNNQGAFRALFVESEERIPEASPQFKNF